MTKWIASAKGVTRGPHTLPYTASHLNGHRVTLSADPLCRQHGLDWLTQILYHNTEALLRRYEFWPEMSTDVQCTYHTDMTNMDDVQFIWRFQVDIPKQMDDVVEAVRQKVVTRLNNTDMYNLGTSLIDPEIVSRISPIMTYVRRNPEFSGRNGSSILYREFQDGADRTVFVGQSVYDDKFESPQYRNKSMTWVQLTRVTPSWTRVSILSVSSLIFTNDGFLPLPEQARLFNVALDPLEAKQEASFATGMQPCARNTTVAWLGYLNDTIRMVHAKKTKPTIHDFFDDVSLCRFEEDIQIR
ncbi:hypothetical protein Ae201684P_004939 [Aphanomyces euteiches]|nr:hypothetical protein Ae201684P_004939 [Aphanomyces euteiches]KAH9156093.1 hypothetical protein AeRB84_001989 [Aphanomyces euteiches]